MAIIKCKRCGANVNTENAMMCAKCGRVLTQEERWHGMPRIKRDRIAVSSLMCGASTDGEWGLLKVRTVAGDDRSFLIPAALIHYFVSGNPPVQQGQYTLPEQPEITDADWADKAGLTAATMTQMQLKLAAESLTMRTILRDGKAIELSFPPSCWAALTQYFVEIRPHLRKE